MKGINVLFGVFYIEKGMPVVQYLCEKLKKELIENGVSVERVEAAKEKKQIEEKLATGDYQILICNEQLGEDRIGAGSIQAWSSAFPNVKIILSVKADKKGGEKLAKLINNIPYYYDAIFENDLTGGNVAAIFVNPRTREDAIRYYGLENREEFKHQKETVSENSIANEEAAVEEAETLKDEKTVVVEPSPKEVSSTIDDVISDAEFDNMVQEFEDLSTETLTEEFETVDKNEVSGESQPVETIKEVGFDFSSMFGGNEAGEQRSMDYQRPFEAERDILKNDVNIEILGTQAVKEPEEKDSEKVDVDISYKVVSSYNDNLTSGLPDRGTVLRVLDYNTMLLEFANEVVLGRGDCLEDYKILFVVKGTKGSFVGGKYKIGVKSFEGYPGRLLGRTTVIVEVPEYDLVKNEIELSECSLIFMKQ